MHVLVVKLALITFLTQKLKKAVSIFKEGRFIVSQNTIRNPGNISSSQRHLFLGFLFDCHGFLGRSYGDLVGDPPIERLFVSMDHPRPSFSPSSPASSCYSCPLSSTTEARLIAEERAEEILLSIRPTILSEEERKEAIDCVKSVLRGYYGVEVLPFGSVPLGTYLPDGDIDLTVICRPNEEEECAKGIANFLQVRQKEEELQIRDVVYISAQVKIVKFSWRNIPIDMSFNQISGLSSLCFLEKVDQAIGKNHLFKRSVVLIKAWCFYESRILGAHHGLLSAFGLETLILYLINLFYRSLDGPLMVLYSFLDFYCTFDWENYCMSVYGPIPISSLQDVVDMQGNDANLYLSKEFLDSCKLPCSGSSTSWESRSNVFPVKYLNVMDPFKDDNNLGRSVSKANFHRIKCALSYGAEKLREILTLPVGRIGEEIEKFFKYTIDRNGRGHRPDVQVPIPAFGTGKYEVVSLVGDYNTFYNNYLYSQWCQECSLLPEEGLPPLNTHASNLHQPGVFNQSASPRKGTEVFLPEPRYYYENLLEPFTRAKGSSSRNHSLNHLQKKSFGRARPRQREYFGPIPGEQGDEANDQDESAVTFEGKKSKDLDTSAEDFPFVEPTAKVDGENSSYVANSLDKFPLLSGSVRCSESKAQYKPSRGKPSKTITFGSFGEPSPATSQRKEADPGNTEILNQVEYPSVSESYALKSMEEFPPLC
ncbi:hypothetical protein MLD38_018847 [Melastoma candidum]|uniref:Uncharacterized protein n=1 Tax=Melastoma candidum TaxID=119954 RepID=A0ACB9QUI0_9MYRT|nr:hypothetical protein MLD38_018847 [Melastoma candidum]